jgi:hypothetical protein
MYCKLLASSYCGRFQVDPRSQLILSPRSIKRVNNFKITSHQLDLQKQREFEKEESIRISSDVLLQQVSYLKNELKSQTIKEEDFQPWHDEISPLAGKYSRKRKDKK